MQNCSKVFLRKLAAIFIVITTNWCCCYRPSEIFTQLVNIYLYSSRSSRKSLETTTDLQCAQVLESIVAEKSTQGHVGKYVNSETCIPLHKHSLHHSLMAVCILCVFALAHKRADALTCNVCSISDFTEGEWEWVRTERESAGGRSGGRDGWLC